MSSRMDSSMHSWASGLTRRHQIFRRDQPLVPDHFTHLTCDKNLQPVLSFLIRHIRPPEEQRHIRLNLKLAQLRKRLKGNEGDLSASEEQFRLKSTILDTSSAVAADITEIQQLNRRKEELYQKEVEVRRRTKLLKVVQDERSREIQHCQFWKTRLDSLLENESSKQDQKSSKSDVVLQKQLQGNLIELEKLHHLIISGSLVSPEAIHQKKLCMWEQVEKTLDDREPSKLLDGMLSEVREGTHILHNMIMNVDLAKDARQLRIKCESDGSFIDEMNPGGVIESVRELLAHMSAAHVKLYVEAHQAQQAASSLTRALKTLNNNISTAAKRVYDDDAVAAAVVNLVRENISIAGEQAALTTAQSLTSSLHNRADAAARAQVALKAKHAKIMSFNKEVQDGIDSIQCLVVSVRNSWLTIKESLEQLQSSIDETLLSTAHPAPVSTNSLGNECEAFTAVPFVYLFTTDLEEFGIQPKTKMSTTPLTWYSENVSEASWKVVSQLCSGMQCWDGVYDTVFQQLNQITSLHNQLEQLTTMKIAMKSSLKKWKLLTGQDVKEMCERAQKSDKKLQEEITVLTTSFEKQLTEASHLLPKVNKLFIDWWEQPAKLIQLKKT